MLGLLPAEALGHSPSNFVFFFGFKVPGIIRGMKVRIRGADRFMAQIVPHMAQVDSVVRHV